MTGTAWCCFLYLGTEIRCPNDAEYLIIYGDSPDLYTHGCADHAGVLIPDDTEARLIPIGWDAEISS